jgi:chitodextrinase
MTMPPPMPTTTSRILSIVLLVATLGSAAWAQRPQKDRVAPTAPTNLVVLDTTETSVTLAWDASSDNSGRFHYVVCCAGTTVTVNQAETSHTLEGLEPGATYTFRVYAKDAAGNLSASSNVVTVTLPGDLAAPTKPVVDVVDVGPTHVSLTWSSSDDGSLIWYSISVDGNPVNTLNSKSATFTCSAVLVPTGCVPLDQETTYTFTVRARDLDGNWSPTSDSVVVTTDPPDPDDHTPPPPPANLAATSDGAFLIVSWEASPDDLTPPSFVR